MGRRSKELEKPVNHERWLLTYADLITLLMIFFIVMYTISNVNSKKFAQVSASISEALLGENTGYFIGEVPGPLMINEDVAITGGKIEAANLKAAKEALDKYIKDQGLKGKVEVSEEERGLVISLKEALLFRIGSAELTPGARDVILKVGQVLIKLPNSLRVEGHTCNLPINTFQFPSNWELSTARATNVLRFLANQVGIEPERLSATGYGEFRPIVPNTSEVNRSRNRRVDIVVLKSIFDLAEPGQDKKKSI
jgi:chemotaxis protein MotB